MTKETIEKTYPVQWVNPNTKKAAEFNRSYRLTTKGNSIFTAYGRPSQRKIEAFSYCENLMKDMKGRGMRMTGAGSDFFSCAFRFTFDGEELLCYITPSYNWVTTYQE